MAEDKASRKINYHSSGIKHYFECPYKFTLSRTVELPEAKPSEAMKLGLLYESYLFGFRSDKEEDPRSEFSIRGLKYNKDGSLSKSAGMKDEKVAPIKAQAEFSRQFFDLDNGEAFKKISYNGNYRDAEMLAGEIDYIGDIWLSTELIDPKADEPLLAVEQLPEKRFVKRRKIVDVKYTSDIYWRWHIKGMMQVLQSILYPYIWFQNTGEMLDFVYFVFWNQSSTIFKQIHIKTTPETFKTAEKIISLVDDDLLKRPQCSWENCLKGDYNRVCEYIEYCDEGRELIAGNEWFDLQDLEPPLLLKTSDEEVDRIFDKLKR